MISFVEVLHGSLEKIKIEDKIQPVTLHSGFFFYPTISLSQFFGWMIEYSNSSCISMCNTYTHRLYTDIASFISECENY